MSDLSWFEVHPPRGLDLGQVTAALRPLATRAKRGVILRTTPIVVFELWLQHGSARWLIGMEERLTTALPGQMVAQLPGLTLVACDTPGRTELTSAALVRIEGTSAMLRLDMAGAVAAGLLQLVNSLAGGETVVVQTIVGPSAPAHVMPPQRRRMDELLGLRRPAKATADDRQPWRMKIKEPLYGIQVRVGAKAASSVRAGALIQQAYAALSLANGSHAQLRSQSAHPLVARRLTEVGGTPVSWAMANAAELAALLGWPTGGVSVPDAGPGLDATPRELLVPTNEGRQRGRILGVSLHPADGGRLAVMPFGALTRGCHVIGPTSSGKSTLLAHHILADAKAGYGVLVMEPRGDLIEDVLARLPPDRHKDVVLLEPAEQGFIIGVNPLNGPLELAERRADEILGLFRELFGSALGPRTTDLLLHTLITVARLPDGCLTDIPLLLTQEGARRRALAQVNDPLVLGPFWAGFSALSVAEAAQVTAPALNKLRALLSRASLRRMLGQPAPRFHFDDLFTKRRIVLVNLNSGLIGPVASELVGSLILQQVWLAIQRRAAMPRNERAPVGLFVDEWQTYTGTLDFATVLATCRGVGAALTVANQNLAQLSPDLRAAVFANARSRVVFRPAQDDARALAAVLGGGLTAADLERLGAFEACARVLVNNAPSEPFAVRTLPLPSPTNDVAALRQAALARYGVDGAAIDQALQARWHGPDPDADGPIGVSRRRSS